MTRHSHSLTATGIADLVNDITAGPGGVVRDGPRMVPCPDCAGSGFDDGWRCPTCDGIGEVPEDDDDWSPTERELRVEEQWESDPEELFDWER